MQLTSWPQKRRKIYTETYPNSAGRISLSAIRMIPVMAWAGNMNPGRSDIRDITGEYPAVYGFDLGRIELGWKVNLDSVPFDKTRQYIQEAYERGGIITLSWHLNNPLTGGNGLG